MQRLLEGPSTQLTQAADVDQQEAQRQPRARGPGFSDAETSHLLDLLETHLPLSRGEWDYVASLHNAAYVGEDRTTDSLKRKFAKPHRKRIPTGDSNIPATVLQAKRVRVEMTRRADLDDGEDAATEAAIDFVARTPPPAPTRPQPTAVRQAPDIPATPPPQVPPPQSTPTTTPSQLDAARPIVHRRGHTSRTEDETDARFLAMMRLSLEQERQRADEQRMRWEQEREEERVRRDEERARRDEEREVERRQRQGDREEDRRRHQEMVSLVLLSGNRTTSSDAVAPRE